MLWFYYILDVFTNICYDFTIYLMYLLIYVMILLYTWYIYTTIILWYHSYILDVFTNICYDFTIYLMCLLIYVMILLYTWCIY